MAYINVYGLVHTVYDCIITFNDGDIFRLRVSEVRFNGLWDYGINTVATGKSADEERVRKADRLMIDATKEARVARRRKRLFEDKSEEDFYFPGAFLSTVHVS